MHLPSVGPKTAERYVFYLLKKNPEELQQLAQTIAELKEKTLQCKICLAITETNPCQICGDAKREQKKICLVANTRDMLNIENTGKYFGLYHVLGGLIDTVAGLKPQHLNIKPLLSRIKKEQIKEIIFALNPTLEGETTSMYLQKLLKPYNVKITRLAQGLPTGANLEYADPLTLGNALTNRYEL